MIPQWMADKRSAVCLACDQYGGCPGRWTILQDRPACPLGKLPSKDDEIAARAWPDGAEQVSGCCDSADNYLSRTPRV
jgi:hypothetical protein